MPLTRRSVDARHLLLMRQPAGRATLPPTRAATGLEHARSLLDGTRPATWLFTGDSVVQGAGQTGAGRTFSEHFADHLKNKMRRLLDVVINTGVPNSRCENLFKTRDWRIQRFQPDVVFLMLGMADAANGPSGRERFREQLGNLVEMLTSSEIAVVLQTPPTSRPDRWNDATDISAFVDIVRDVASEHQVALIDHWSLFEDRLAHAKSEPDWWSAGGQLPNVRGHVELARQLVDTLLAKS